MRLILLLSFFISSLLAINLSDEKISNGKTLLVEFDKKDTQVYKYISLGMKKFKILKHPFDSTKLYAYLPINYYTKPELKNVKVSYKKEKNDVVESFYIDVKAGDYKKEKITVNKSKVNPKAKAVKDRISKEYKEAMRIYNTITQDSYVSGKYILPIDSKITSDFGKARVYNGTLKGYHSGTDFRAKVGTPIVASNDGVVVLVKDRFYSGGTILIDHGHGVYSCYFHMSGYNVYESQKVKKGEVIGLSGDTGRVTGPHLHFAFRVGGVQVDPLQFIELFNKKIYKKVG
jgi:murein DD-endopeptidase MepM/ murein hydrolase activator NlpD